MELKKQEVGTIRFYDDKKGFGFIIPEDGSKDIFFHISGVDEKLKPAKDIQVIYNERNTIRGLIAVDIVPA